MIDTIIGTIGLIWLIIIIIWALFFPCVSAAIAKSKNRSGLGWFLLALVIGPFALCVALLPAKPDYAKSMQCPDCAEYVKVGAVKCRYCGCLFATKSTSVESVIDLIEPAEEKNTIPEVENAALRLKNKSGQESQRFIKYVVTLTGLLILIAIFIRLFNSGKSTTGDSFQPIPNVATQSAKPYSPARQPSEKKIYAMGQNVHIGYMSYVVNGSWWSRRLSDNEFLDQRPDSLFLFVNLTARNNDSEARTIPPFKLIDEKGAEYETSSKAWIVEGSIGILHDLNPDVSTQGSVVFDVPIDHQYKLKLSGGYWSSDTALVVLHPNDKEENKSQGNQSLPEKPQNLEAVEKNLDKLIATPKAIPRSSSAPAETVKPQRENQSPHLVYSAPPADFFIGGGDIQKNLVPFSSSGCFTVELHSKYKNQARTNMIETIRKQINSGELAVSPEKGNPDLLGDVVTTAFFDTQKKTVTFSGKQSYVDINNATIASRQVQETFDISSPKYSTLGKVAGSIESLLQASEGSKAQRDTPRTRITAAEVVQKLRASSPTTPTNQIAGLYGEQIRKRIAREWKPTRNQNIAGIKAVVEVQIKRSGGIISIRIMKKSGNELFDDAAVRAVNRAAPLPPVPEAITDSSLKLILTFLPGGVS
jgi:TonB family protein